MRTQQVVNKKIKQNQREEKLLYERPHSVTWVASWLPTFYIYLCYFVNYCMRFKPVKNQLLWAADNFNSNIYCVVIRTQNSI